MAQSSNSPNRPLAKRYGLALYRLATATTATGVGNMPFATAVKNLRDAIGQSADAWERMAISPVLSSDQKKDVVGKVLAAQKIADKKISDLLYSFFDLLVVKGRLVMAGLILEEVATMLLADEGKVSAVVTTAKPIAEAEKKLLEKQLATSLPKLLPKDMEKKLDNNLTMSYRVDETLLGGLTVMVESYNIDLSVKSKLAKLEQKLS
ncbi:MAG: FoF1 ATP synthase subunit delta [Hydrotalea sp.]|nr:FoF1 ATP synthase subunit delta [Hydrotalea sp.]